MLFHQVFTSLILPVFAVAAISCVAGENVDIGKQNKPYINNILTSWILLTNSNLDASNVTTVVSSPANPHRSNIIVLYGSGYTAVISYQEKGECRIQRNLSICDVEGYCLYNVKVDKNSTGLTEGSLIDDCFLIENPTSPDVQVGQAYRVRQLFIKSIKDTLRNYWFSLFRST